jgi:hypothetical protein
MSILYGILAVVAVRFLKEGTLGLDDEGISAKVIYL